MDLKISLRAAGCALGLLCLGVGLRAPAATINATYTVTVTASGDPTNPPLIGNGTGSVVPLGSMIWRDMAFPNLATGAVTGTFTATFANGTLFGNLLEQLDFSAPPTAVPLTQILEVTGGTGAFLWYNGTLSGSGTANLITNDPSTISGSGTLNTTPEPNSVALLPIGLLCFVAYRTRALRSRSVGQAIRKVRL